MVQDAAGDERGLSVVRKIQAVLFDFGGTLDYPQHWLDRFLRHYVAAGLGITRECLDSAYSDATGKAYGCRGLRQGGLAEVVGYLVRRQLEYLAHDRRTPSQARELIGETAETLATTIAAGFVDESLAGLESSRSLLLALPRHLRLGVISNFYGNLDHVLNEAGLGGLIDVVADSGQLGIYKPDPRLFETAIRRLNLKPEAVAMVGDSLAKDCAPARGLGMRTIWLRTDACQTDPEGLADLTIGTLDELRHLEW